MKMTPMQVRSARFDLRAFAVLCFLCGGSLAQTIHYVVPPGTAGVTSTPPFTAGWHEAATNIQHAVDAAASGATVLVTNGIFTSGGPAVNDTMIWFGSKGIKLRSVNGPDVTILDGNYPAVTNRVIGWYNASGALLDGFTMRNGYTLSSMAYSGYGGGIYSRGGSGITNCIISGNTGSGQGGGGYVRYHDFVADCVISNNACGSYGGLFCLDIGIITNCTVVGNTASGSGGGIGLGNTTPLMVDCLVSNNTAGVSGGGIFVNGPGITIRDCRVFNNTATTGYGGGIAAWQANTRVEHCLFVGNAGASTGGGGASLRYAGTYASNCWFEANTASHGGGAYLQGGAYLFDCILTNNAANGNGGGIHIQTTASVFDCLVISNRAATGGGIYGSDNSLFRNVDLVRNTAANGGGAYFSGAGTLATGCRFEENVATASGGGLFLRLSGYFDVQNCEFIGNSGTQYGGGLYDDAGTSTISNCLFAANSVAGGSQPWGGGIRGPALVTHCVITNNSAAQRGGGIFGAGILRNSLVAVNTGGGAVHNVNSVENCTIVTNNGYGAYGFLAGYAVTNSVVYGNTSADVACSAQSGVRTVWLANCLYGTLGAEAMNLIASDNITGRAPGFVNVTAGDFQLAPGSPCINRGVNLAWMTADAEDLAGERRVRGSLVDIGAYEAPSSLNTIISIR